MVKKLFWKQNKSTVTCVYFDSENVLEIPQMLWSWILLVCAYRSVAVKSEAEVAELRKNLQQAVSQKLKAEREKQDAQDQVNKYSRLWQIIPSVCLFSFGVCTGELSAIPTIPAP